MPTDPQSTARAAAGIPMKPTPEQIERVAKWLDTTLPKGSYSLMPHYFKRGETWKTVGMIVEACKWACQWIIIASSPLKPPVWTVNAGDLVASADCPAAAAILAVDAWLESRAALAPGAAAGKGE